MTPEQQPSKYSRPEDIFGFTEHERLIDRVSHERLISILDHEASTVHRVELSSNSYGEFLFITLSRQAEDRRICVSFFGLGLHEFRERWLINEWHWYHTNAFPDLMAQEVEKGEAKEQIQQRLEEVRSYAHSQEQTGRGKLFEMLANLTDDDGAISELEDLGDLADWLADDLE